MLRAGCVEGWAVLRAGCVEGWAVLRAVVTGSSGLCVDHWVLYQCDW